MTDTNSESELHTLLEIAAFMPPSIDREDLVGAFLAWHHQQLEAKTTETAKAYGGCTNCKLCREHQNGVE